MFILLFFTIVNFHLIQTINHCGPETHFDAPLVDMMFSFTNPSAEELSSLNENSRESCLEQCCNTDKCNIASFNQSLAAVTGDNCFLYKCLPLENCQFQDSVSIISYVLKRDKDDTTTIQNEIDTTDPPPKDQEFIGEKVLEVINDTDIDTDLLKQELNTGNTNFPLLSSSVLSTNTNNLTTKGTTSITLASHPAASTNTNSSPSSNNPLTTATTNKTNSPVSLTSSASSTTQNISSTTVEKQSNGSSTVTNQMVLATNQHPTKASLQPSIVVSTEQGNNKSSVVHPQTTLNNIANTSTKTVLLNETKTTSEPNMANMTELETTLNHAMTTQHNVTSPKKITTTNSILNTLTKALNLTNIVNETAKTTMTTTTSTTTTTTTMMMTTELTTKETTEYLSTKEATTTKETTTSGNDTQTIVTNQPTTESSNMSKSTEKPITTGMNNLSDNILSIKTPNQTVSADINFTSEIVQDLIHVTPASATADIVISTIWNDSAGAIQTYNQTLMSNTASVIVPDNEISETVFNDEIRIQNNTIFFGDLNITFADTNQMKEEKEESNVLSAALIAALSFGILFFFAVLVLIGKRCFDSWQKRHYSRIDYLVNGMYN
ncbi:uncharacterized protein LOC127725718 isoform X1 [Mytilus californianus]|uniref:uncharacterized protein LOC127725718 isoform X1 n=1 Tax=Mytilus californianus TaxID=6549 RepID=UPI0022467A50|nr:uncharacterized protein LOC127725718 isoform X1 [Mytilus californianus]